MSLLLVNVLLVVGILALIVVARRILRRWYRKRRAVSASTYRAEIADALLRESSFDDFDNPSDARMRAFNNLLRRREDLDSALRLLNLATTIVGLVPLGVAVFNLIANHQQVALIFNLVSLATVVIGKGALFLLTLVLVPLLKAIPVGVGTGIGSIAARKAWERMESRDRAERQPSD